MLEEGTTHQHMKWQNGLDNPDEAIHDHATTADSINDITETKNDK